jgi:type IV pilus assembly protein PilF
MMALMRATRVWTFACLALAAVMLAGCGAMGTHSDDATGALGTEVPASKADIYVALAGEYYARGQMDIALQRANQALDEDSGNANAQLINALIYQRLGETAKAEEFFKRAVELDPKDPTIRNAWGAYFCSQKRYAEADAQFQLALDNPLYPSPWVARTNAGICAKDAGNRAKAQGYLHQALTANPNFGPAMLTLAELELSQGDARSASALLTRYFNTSPPTAQALGLGVRVERQLGNKKLAKSYAAVLKQRFPGSPEAQSL